MNKIHGIFLALVCALVFSSCDAFSTEMPPYVISKPVCSITAKTGYYNFVGIEFSYSNTSKKSIKKLDVSFMVYDAQTKKNPFIGSNIINRSFNNSIAVDEKKQFIIPLDEYIYVIPDKPYLIDFFRIARIHYSDGSTWEDPHGKYFTRSY